MQKSRILTQSIDGKPRPTRGLALLLGAVVSAIGMATAVAVAPLEQQSAEVKTVIEQLAIEGIRPIDLGESGFFYEERIQRGETLGSILSRLGVTDPAALEFISTNPGTKLMYQQLAPGKIVVARTTDSGQLLSLHFPLNGNEAALVIQNDSGHLTVHEKAQRFETHVVMKGAEIQRSLFEASDSAGVPDAIATQLAEIFSSDIDFHRDLRKGDRFGVVYEMHYLNGQPARSGRILAAEFSNDGRIFRAINSLDEGRDHYYTPEGKSLRKAFLRSPLEFSRITSGFSMRFHPILQQWRAHKGVDYGAPSGTKVRATADGTIAFTGQKGGYGNLVVIKHAGNYSTAYGHLKNFGSNISPGKKVAQGDIVGYVGQTGWATGPHLHYEFRVNEQQVNPLALNLPTTLPMDTAQLRQFKIRALPLLAQLDLLRDTQLSMAE